MRFGEWFITDEVAYESRRGFHGSIQPQQHSDESGAWNRKINIQKNKIHGIDSIAYTSFYFKSVLHKILAENQFRVCTWSVTITKTILLLQNVIGEAKRLTAGNDMRVTWISSYKLLTGFVSKGSPSLSCSAAFNTNLADKKTSDDGIDSMMICGCWNEKKNL